MATGVPYQNRVLRINLKTKEVKHEIYDPKITRQFIGGNGTGLKMLYDEVGPEVKPFDPENKLIFTAGPFNGTRMPGSGIYQVSTRGPLTGLLTSAQSNGYFGARMRHAGWETIVLEDISDEWIYIVINDDKVEFRNADHLRGVGTWETQRRVKEEVNNHPRASVACIGPAGENLSPMCGIHNDEGHIAATNGPGAVMGSKHVKAIVITPSRNTVDTWEDESKAIRKNLLDDASKTGLGGMVMRVGTLGYFDNLPGRGGEPTKNYSTNVYNYDQFKIDQREEWIERKRTTCWACPWAHTADVKIRKGIMAGYEGEEPEYEGFAGCTTLIGVDDMGVGIYLCNIIEDMGFDAKEFCFDAALAYECFNEGLITLEDTEGLDLTWGNWKSYEQLVKDCAFNRGFGAKLFNGTKAFGLWVGNGAEQRGVFSGRGISPNVVDERMSIGAYYNLVMSETGSFGGFAGKDPEVGNAEGVDLFNPSDENFAHLGFTLGGNQIKWYMMDAYGCCFFYGCGQLKYIVPALNTITGWDMTEEEVVKVGRRIMALSRALNIRYGLTRDKEWDVSDRFSQPPVDGPAHGVVTKMWSEQMFLNYYKRNGWDLETTRPLPETLKELDLDYVIDDIWPDFKPEDISPLNSQCGMEPHVYTGDNIPKAAPHIWYADDKEWQSKQKKWQYWLDK